MSGNLTPNLTAVAKLDIEACGNHYVWLSFPYANVDRPCCQGISCSKNPTLARRLVRAVNAQRVAVDTEVRTDVNNKTYVSHSCTVSGRRLNSDLKKLGF